MQLPTDASGARNHKVSAPLSQAVFAGPGGRQAPMAHSFKRSTGPHATDSDCTALLPPADGVSGPCTKAPGDVLGGAGSGDPHAGSGDPHVGMLGGRDAGRACCLLLPPCQLDGLRSAAWKALAASPTSACLDLPDARSATALDAVNAWPGSAVAADALGVAAGDCSAASCFCRLASSASFGGNACRSAASSSPGTLLCA